MLRLLIGQSMRRTKVKAFSSAALSAWLDSECRPGPSTAAAAGQ